MGDIGRKDTQVLFMYEEKADFLFSEKKKWAGRMEN
jgi:hypothetical protein